MTTRRPLLLAPLAGLLLFANLAAQPAPDASRAEPEDLTRWRWVHPVKVPAAGQRTDFVVPPAVFGAARADLADLRLTDTDGKPIPYALRVRRPVDAQEPVPGQPIDKVRRPDGGAALTLDLGEKPAEHNEVEVNVPPGSFVRAVVVEGSDDRATWNKLLGGHLVRLDVGDGPVVKNRFRYPASRFRYVRVSVRPDPVLEKDQPVIDNAQVFKRVRVPGESVETKATLLDREPARQSGSFASAWRIDLGADNVPCSKLILQIDEDLFSRSYHVEALRPGDRPGRDYWEVVASGQLHREPGRPRAAMEIDLPREVSARWLRLVVLDDRNTPLTVRSAAVRAAVRQVVFVPPAAGPLRLYSGNPDAGEPRYDFAATLPAQLDPPPARTQVDPAEKNPQFVPPPKPFTERWPYLVDGVLSVAALGLVGVLGVLARSAIRRHDQA